MILSRAKLTLTYPARFMLVAAMNPCPCGYYGTGRARCVCRPSQIERYTQRVSGPLLDRIDLHIDVPSLDGERLTDERRGEPTRTIRDRVRAARDRQTRRFADTRCGCNGDMGPRELRIHCRIDGAGERLLRAAVRRLGLSARAYHRVLRVARTIADLEGTERISSDHLGEAVQYRSLDRKPARV